MSTVRAHYEALLAGCATWALGDLEQAIERETARFFRLGVGPSDGEAAIDLGAGSGVHSVALARLGYAVTAVDQSAALLAELQRLKRHLPIRGVEADLTALPASVPHDARVIACMGDTLLQLPSEDAVREVFRAAHERLRPDGSFVATFRDLTGDLPERAILVRADADRILTCLLEPRGDRVRVQDVLHERQGASWRLQVGAYEKLRLAPRWVERALREAGFRTARVEEDVRTLAAIATR